MEYGIYLAAFYLIIIMILCVKQTHHSLISLFAYEIKIMFWSLLKSFPAYFTCVNKMKKVLRVRLYLLFPTK